MLPLLLLPLWLLPFTHASTPPTPAAALPPSTWTLTTPPGTYTFAPGSHLTLYLQRNFSSHRDADGLTLIPPSAVEFAHTFGADLKSVFPGLEHVCVELVDAPPPGKAGGIYLSRASDVGAYTYENGVETSEGFEVVVGEKLVEVRGAGARGMWWGTRTLLQEMVLARANGGGKVRLPTGRVKDAPAYRTRGFMLDAGRKWYSSEFLKELCTYASWFRMSEFHFHASDNYPLNRGRNATWQDIYSQFALLPEDPALLPLVQRHNESHTRSTFDDIQRHCASRGITVIPEIETPGHALAITKWKPQLALARKADLLNLTHPETLPTIKAIWGEFLPWFHTKEVHIGADEYESSLADDYIAFVNALSEFVTATSGKRSRIWGTYEPSNTSVISHDIITQHWQYGQSEPLELAAAGYDLINSEDRWAYTGLKNDHTPILPAPYPQFFDARRVLSFGGRQWEPSMYSPTDATQQLPASSPRNLGAIMATWNDNGPDATTQIEYYYSIRSGIPLVAARSWSGSRGPLINQSTLPSTLETLITSAPSVNLERRLPASFRRGPTLLDWTPPRKNPTHIGAGSKGVNYTLAVTYRGPFTLSSPADNTQLALRADGSLVFSADGFEYPLRAVAVGDGFDPGHPGRIWTNVTTSTHVPVTVPPAGEVLIRTDVLGGSRVWIGGVFWGRFEVFVFGGRNTLFSWSQMAFVAPVETASGGVVRVRVWEGLRG